MKYRKLRIAFSAVCGIVCLLLIVFWVFSYSQTNLIRLGEKEAVVSHDGTMRTLETRFASESEKIIMLIEGEPIPAAWFGPTPRYSFLGFGYSPKANWPQIIVPYWFLVLLFTTLALVPRNRLRFSLRTMLIATTLVAVGLGLIVYAVR